MLPKKHKLNTKQFKYVFKKGKRYFSEHFQFIVLPAESFRVAVVVSKKDHVTAVSRNRARRLIFEVFQRVLPTAPALEVVLLKRGKKSLNYLMVEKEITRFFETLKSNKDF